MCAKIHPKNQKKTNQKADIFTYLKGFQVWYLRFVNKKKGLQD